MRLTLIASALIVLAIVALFSRPKTASQAVVRELRETSRSFAVTTSRAAWQPHKMTFPKVGDDDMCLVSFSSPKKGIIASNKGGAYITEDGGLTWKEVTFAKYNSSYISNVSFVGENLGWLSRFPIKPIYSPDADARENGIFRTNDGGASWELLTQPLNSLIFQVKFIDDKEGWAVGSSILYTTNAGETWVERFDNLKKYFPNPDLISHAIAVIADKPRQAIVITNNHCLAQTIDGGLTWNIIGRLPQEVSRDIPKLYLSGDRDLWLVDGADSREGIWSKIHRLQNDESLDSVLFNNIRVKDMAFISKNHIVACGTMKSGEPPINTIKREGVILHSVDAGRNWEIVYRDGYSDSINALAVVGEKTVWAAADKGQLLEIQLQQN